LLVFHYSYFCVIARRSCNFHVSSWQTGTQ
jgi:hypothetical protein